MMVVNLATERAARLLETMRIMSMRDSVYYAACVVVEPTSRTNKTMMMKHDDKYELAHAVPVASARQDPNPRATASRGVRDRGP